jgi:hypothetical protein
MRARPIIVPHSGQDGRFVAIDAGVASWSLSMSLFPVTIAAISPASRPVHVVFEIIDVECADREQS